MTSTDAPRADAPLGGRGPRRSSTKAPRADAPLGGDRSIPPTSRPRRRIEVFLIGVAAELAGMHPQTLRVYERRGLITPRRSPRNTRLYSEADVERLRRIQELSELGMSLAGIERALELEARLARAERRADRAEERLAAAEAALAEREAAHRRELAALRRTGTEIVPVPAAGVALVPRYAPVVRRTRTTMRARRI